MWCRVALRLPGLRFGDFVGRVRRSRHPTMQYTAMHILKEGSAMAQNIYDNPAFFEGYAQLPRSVQGMDGAPEWPMLKSMLPDLAGKTVIDLGCGYGWFCRSARELGAAQVTGVDISEKMLARAAELTADPAITYERRDLEDVKLEDNSLDLVYSSLALHYLPELDTLFRHVQRALKP